MSLEIEIVPTRLSQLYWKDIEARWRAGLSPALNLLLGQTPRLYRLKTREVHPPNIPLIWDKGYYYFELAVPNTLGLSLTSNIGVIDEVEMLEDFGRNLEPDTIHSLAATWRQIGHTGEISSFGGRGPQELPLLVALGAAVAELCEGYIILMHSNFFDLDAGVYRPEEFRKASPKKPLNKNNF